LQRYVDTLIVIPNQNLFRVANERTTFAEAFGKADQVLHSGVRSITDLMVLPGLINLDFADVRTVMTEMGKAMMGTGEGTGEGRALMAAENAIQNPLLDEVTLKGAKAVLVNITGGLDMTLLEVDEAANAISGQVDPEANIIFGAAFDPSLDGMVRVSVVATGMDGASIAAIETYQERHARESSRHSVAQAAVVTPVPAPTVDPVYASVECPAPMIAPQPQLFDSQELPAQVASRETAEPAIQPTVVSADHPVTRIVDPSVAEHEDEPLFPHRPIDDRRQKSGWLSLFNRPPRQEPPAYRPSPARTNGGAQAAVEPVEDVHANQSEELEIPSFLRRLAN
jgi:cell division protein FtsZ